MLKLKIVFVVMMMAVGFSAKSQVMPLSSEILNPSEMEKPALCEVRRMVTGDIYMDDQNSQSLIMLGQVTERAQEFGMLLPSSLDYLYSINSDLNGYNSYVSNACLNYTKQLADNACAIDRKWNSNMNQYVTSKPQSVQVTGRFFTFIGMNYSTIVNQRGFEQTSSVGNEPPFFLQINYQVSCDGNGVVTAMVVDKS